MKKSVIKRVQEVLEDIKNEENIQIHFETTENFIDLLFHLDNKINITLDKQLGIYKELSTFYKEYKNDNPSNYISSNFMKTTRTSKRFSAIIKNYSNLKRFQYEVENVDFNYLNINQNHITQSTPFLNLEAKYEDKTKLYVLPCNNLSNEIIKDFLTYVQCDIKKSDKLNCLANT